MARESLIKDLHARAATGSMGFDQFVLGATLAALAYLAQTQKYANIGWNEPTLNLLPLALLALAAWFGFKRIESVITLIRLNARYLERCNRIQVSDDPKSLETLTIAEDKTGFYYRLRNRAVLLAVVSHVGVKIVATYPVFGSG